MLGSSLIANFLLTMNGLRRVITCFRGSPKETIGSFPFSSFEHVPDSSNHSLCQIKLFSFSNLDGNFGGNQLPDGSINLSPSSSTTTPHTHHTTPQDTTHHNTTQHHTQHHTDTRTERSREREKGESEKKRQRKRRERKRRSPSQPCFTIFQVLACVLQSLSNDGNIYIAIHIYAHTYTCTYTQSNT